MGIEKPKFREKPVQSRESIEVGKEPIVDIKIDKKTEKEIFEKYPDLEFLVTDIFDAWEDFTEEDYASGEYEKLPTDEMPGSGGAAFLLNPEYFSLEIEDPKEREDVQKFILKKIFKDIGFNPKNYEMIKEITEKSIDEEEVTVKYFKIKEPTLELSFDGTDWILEKKKEEEK